MISVFFKYDKIHRRVILNPTVSPQVFPLVMNTCTQSHFKIEIR